MRVGVIGRHPDLLTRAVDLVTRHGHTALGALRDEEAVAWVDQQLVDALVIGGGVEPASRDALTQAAVAGGVQVVEVFGPENLGLALEGLGQDVGGA